jgi:small-conductance mechanosensitive channel
MGSIQGCKIEDEASPMIIPRQSRFTRQNRLSIILCLTGFAFANGQIFAAASTATNAPTTAAAAVATNAPSATPPISLADVVSQAQTISTRLQDEQATLAADPTLTMVEQGLPLLTRRIDDRLAEDQTLLESAPSLSRLQSAEGSWQKISDQLNVSKRSLTDRANGLDAQMTQLGQDAATWKATLASAQASAPAVVLQRVSEVIAAIGQATQATQAAREKILALQALVAVQDTRVTDGLENITKAAQAARNRLFDRDSPPLWSAEAGTQAGVGVMARERESFQTQLDSLETYLGGEMAPLFVHFLILVLLIIGFYRMRRAIHLQAREEVALQHAARIFNLPLATAILIALLATGFFYPQAPRLLWAVVGAAALIPAIIIIRHLVEPALYPVLYAIVIAYFVDRVRYISTPGDLLSRFLLIFEMVAGSLFLLWLLRSTRLTRSGLATDRIECAIRIYLQVAFFVLIAAGLANVAGYVQLSELLARGMLESSYLAVVLYAALRIFDALVLSALSIRPLTRLGMVRKYQDLLYGNIATFIRWGAFLLWGLAALQLFAVRGPVWHETKAILAAKSPSWGSLSFSLGPCIRFGITVWLAFLLSRFIRFVLQEEVYPRLNLSRGLPYAVSTMVHYAILVVGFLVALEALGVDLSQFTLLAGALGVGVGLGLQNITNNFVSGIILLFERPIKVGDMIQVDTSMGEVERIGIRASIVRLTNGAEVIVPNANLISNPVTNWTLSNSQRTLEIPVTVASKVDPQHVLSLLIDAARANPRVLKDPPPQALLITFGGASLTFRLRAWIDSGDAWMQITSELSLSVNAALAKENIALG